MWFRTKSVSSWDCYTTSWSHFVIKWESTVYVLVTATYIKICPVLPNDAQYKTSSNFKTNGLQISLPYKLYIFTLKIEFLIGRMGFKPRVAPVDGVAFFRLLFVHYFCSEFIPYSCLWEGNYQWSSRLSSSFRDIHSTTTRPLCVYLNNQPISTTVSCNWAIG